MARKATRDTYGVEIIGGVEVRRLIKAGDQIPDTYAVESDSDVEGGSAAAVASADYPQSQADAQEASNAEELKGQALQDRAKELDIEGRSDMNADELREAIADAEADQ